jgi:hypothetical protein
LSLSNLLGLVHRFNFPVKQLVCFRESEGYSAVSILLFLSVMILDTLISLCLTSYILVVLFPASTFLFMEFINFLVGIIRFRIADINPVVSSCWSLLLATSSRNLYHPFPRNWNGWAPSTLSVSSFVRVPELRDWQLYNQCCLVLTVRNPYHLFRWITWKMLPGIVHYYYWRIRGQKPSPQSSFIILYNSYSYYLHRHKLKLIWIIIVILIITIIIIIIIISIIIIGISGSVVGWGTMLQAGRSRVRSPMGWNL